jgi:hypothetical protein
MKNAIGNGCCGSAFPSEAAPPLQPTNPITEFFEALKWAVHGPPKIEVARQRLVTVYIVTGLSFLLLPGTFPGVWNLVSISARHSLAGLSQSWLQAHGHAQISDGLALTPCRTWAGQALWRQRSGAFRAVPSGDRSPADRLHPRSVCTRLNSMPAVASARLLWNAPPL